MSGQPSPESEVPVKSRRGIQSIEIGGRLLVALVEEGAAMRLGDLARKAGMPTTNAHPYLVSFTQLGLVEQNELTGEYELGALALRLGLAALGQQRAMQLAIPQVAVLSLQIAHTIGLSMMGSRGPTIVHIHRSGHPIHVNMQTGTVMSVHTTATGLAFAAFLPPRQVDQMVSSEMRARPQPVVDGYAFDRDKFDRTLVEVRRQGLSRVRGEPIPGISAMCAPVFDQNGIIQLGITAIGPSGTLDVNWDGMVARYLRDCADRLSQSLNVVTF